jgi:hypothetical protein
MSNLPRRHDACSGVARAVALASAGLLIVCPQIFFPQQSGAQEVKQDAVQETAQPGAQDALPSEGSPLKLRDAHIRPPPVPARDAAKVESSLARGIHFLLVDQNTDGSWGTAERTKELNIYAPVPGAHQAFRSAVTGLCVAALIESGDRSLEVQQAIDRGQTWLLANLARLRRGSPDALYNVWGHGYGITALVRLFHRQAEDQALGERIKSAIDTQVELLGRYESIDGGWGYYDFRAGTKQPASSSTSFMNAAVLIALKEAQDIGVQVPERLVTRAISATLRQRKPDGTYLYGEYLKWSPMHPINRPGGSLGRCQACNVALHDWDKGNITEEVFGDWLDQLFARDLWLDLGRKRPVPHSSFYAVAGYFYYFGHYYAALAIEALPADQRERHLDQLAARLLPLQETDGSWWDYPLYNYHQQYGTAFAILSLVRCRDKDSAAKRN